MDTYIERAGGMVVIYPRRDALSRDDSRDALASRNGEVPDEVQVLTH